MDVVSTQSFCAFKSNIKQRIISTYSEKCVIPFCDSCKIVTENFLNIVYPLAWDTVYILKNGSAYFVLACIYVYNFEVYLRIFTLVLLVNILNLDY